MRSLTSLPTPLLAIITAITFPLARAADELVIDITTPVKCSRPSQAGDEIAVHYRGSLESTGAVFDESYKRGQPIKFTLGSHQVIEGWDQGLLDMCPGEERKLTIPPDLAYGARGRPPVIPPASTLIFETRLVDIVGVEQEDIAFTPSSTTMRTSTTTEQTFSIETAPSEPPVEEAEEEEDSSTLSGKPLTPPDSSMPAPSTQEGECHLLGPFALLVQGALGLVAILSLVFKRWREIPKRPWRIFFFDVSKQVIGSCLTHVLNLAMSMLGAVDMVSSAKKAALAAAGDEGGAGGAGDGGRRMPNPCSFYLLNLGLDTTLGIPVLYLLLRILHVAFAYTPLARPKESIKSGHYGTPPHTSWWAKQSLIYFIGLTGMKMFVLFLFTVLPWLPWVGDWALRWTEGNEALQVTFAMFVFPLAMNGVQYWLIDNFIMERQGKKDQGGSGSYERVQGEDDDRDDDEDTLAVEESMHAKSDESDEPALTEINPTPIPIYEERGESSRSASPQGSAKSGIAVEQHEIRSRR